MFLPRIKAICSSAVIALILAACAGCGPKTGSRPSPHSEALSPRVLFTDVAKQAGLDYTWTIPGKRPLNILETIGNGCAFLDYNNDGNLDILLVGPSLALYQGDGHGHFTDVTHQTGLDKFHGHYLGCAVGDYDNDGYDDIYISGYRTGLLLHNEHGKSFRDVTAQSGIAPQPWGTSCAWGDIDNSGRLDLYICNYVVFGPNTKPQLCVENNTQTSCGPYEYTALKGVMYRNLGGGRFKEVTADVGADKVSGKALGVAFADFNSSGYQSLVISNDEMPGDLLENTGGHFKNIGPDSGTAFSQTGQPHGGMGVDWGDYVGDGRLDMAVATFRTEPKEIYRNMGHDTFIDESASLGVAIPTTPNVAFGMKWIDFTNSGSLGLMITSGHISDNMDKIEQGAHYREPTQLFVNDGPSGFADLSSSSGPDLQRPIVGRGLATGDYDNDGRLDALVVDSEGSPLLLHNMSSPVGHWLEVDLVGTKSNRDGYGALLTASFAGRSELQLCHSDGSYMSSSDKRVHFGLGPATTIDKLVIHWPSGTVDTLNNLSVDRVITVKEGKGIQ